MQGGFFPASPPLEKKTANTGRELSKVHSVGLELWVSLWTHDFLDNR